MLQDARKWLAEAKLNDENGSVGVSVGMTVDAWFEFWIINYSKRQSSFYFGVCSRRIRVAKRHISLPNPCDPPGGL